MLNGNLQAQWQVMRKMFGKCQHLLVLPAKCHLAQDNSRQNSKVGGKPLFFFPLLSNSFLLSLFKNLLSPSFSKHSVFLNYKAMKLIIGKDPINQFMLRSKWLGWHYLWLPWGWNFCFGKSEEQTSTYGTETSTGEVNKKSLLNALTSHGAGRHSQWVKRPLL